MKKRAVVICPGRGTYSKETSNYLAQNRNVKEFLDDLDARRIALREPTVRALDASEFKPAVHTKGEHASSLIYACAYSDFMAIDREKYDVVAITGNSMGWYLAMACGGSFDWAGAFAVINGMGSMMKEQIVGGQVIYPVCDKNWVSSRERIESVERTVAELNLQSGIELYTSIYLGGYIVLGGNKAGIAAALKALPPQENYPFQLLNHAAFHTPLMRDTSTRAFATIPNSQFRAPKIPLIDGTGHIWQPYSSSLEDLYHYTLGTQVVEAYDLTRAVTVALKEFAPEHLILLGPGSTLGGSLGQILIQNDRLGLKSKAQFVELQKTAPMVLAMGRPDQRALVI